MIKNRISQASTYVVWQCDMYHIVALEKSGRNTTTCHLSHTSWILSTIRVQLD